MTRKEKIDFIFSKMPEDQKAETRKTERLATELNLANMPLRGRHFGIDGC